MLEPLFLDDSKCAAQARREVAHLLPSSPFLQMVPMTALSLCTCLSPSPSQKGNFPCRILLLAPFKLLIRDALK